MKIECSRCGKRVKINKNRLKKRLMDYFEKHKLYLGRCCRQPMGIYLDVDTTIQELEKIRERRK